MIDQYFVEFAIVVFERDEDDVDIKLRDSESNVVVFRNEFLRKSLVRQYVNDSFRIFYWVDEDEKWFWVAVKYNDEFDD